MAELYGNVVNQWRAYALYSVSESSTSVTVSVSEAGFQACGWSFDISGNTLLCWIDMDNAEIASGTGDIYTEYPAWGTANLASASKTFAKTKQSRTIGLAVRTQNTSGYMDGTSIGEVGISVPALAAYSVSYNANGGTNAPASQTKWHGESLTLTTATPTKTGCSFAGWSDSTTGSVVYSSGDSYTANASITLYAIWKTDYISPSISNLSVDRSSSSGTYSSSGKYGKIVFDWKIEQTGLTCTGVEIQYKLASATTWTLAYSSTPGGTSGSVSTVIGSNTLSTSYSYDILVTVSDSSGSSTATSVISQATPIIDIGYSGKSIGLRANASTASSTLTVGLPSYFSSTSVYIGGYEARTVKYAKVGYNGTYASSNTKYWRIAAYYSFMSNRSKRVRFSVFDQMGDPALDEATGTARNGILSVKVTIGSSASTHTESIFFEEASASLDPNDFAVESVVNGGLLSVYLWCRCQNSMQCTYFYPIMDAGGTLESVCDWTLYSRFDATTSNGYAAPTTHSGTTTYAVLQRNHKEPIIGTKVLTGTGATSIELFSSTELIAIYGSSLPRLTCSVTNGDYSSSVAYIPCGCYYRTSTAGLYVAFTSAVPSGTYVRINYALFASS